jgi:hypothetical protein
MTPRSIDEADDGGILSALLRRHRLTAEGANLAQHGSNLVYFVRDPSTGNGS